MPVEAAVEAVVQVAAEAAVQVTGKIAGDTVNRRFGWKGCVALVLTVAGLIAVAVYLLT